MQGEPAGPPPPDKCYRLRQVAALLGKGIDYVRAKVRSGELVAVNLGDALKPRYVVRQKDLTAFLEGRRVMTETPAPKRKPRRERPQGWTDYYPEA